MQSIVFKLNGFFTLNRRTIKVRKDNEGETIFTPPAQAEFLKNVCEDDARPTPTLPIPTVVMPVTQFSIPFVHRELWSLDISKGAGPDIHPQMVRWLADFLAEPLS